MITTNFKKCKKGCNRYGGSFRYTKIANCLVSSKLVLQFSIATGLPYSFRILIRFLQDFHMM